MRPDPFQIRRDFARSLVREAADGNGLGAIIRVGYITEEDGGPVVLHRGTHGDGFDFKFDPDDTETQTGFMNVGGAYFTGQRVLFIKIDIGAGVRWEVLEPGADQWSGSASELTSSGPASIPYWRDDTGADATCVVTAELFNVNSPISGTCWIMFNGSNPNLENPEIAFVAIPRNCPDYVAVEE